MKKLFVFFIAGAAMLACKDQEEAEVKTIEVATARKTEVKPENLAKAEFTIDGMTCAIGCAATIQKNLNKREGVRSAKVDYEKKLAMVEYDKTKLGFDDLAMTVVKTADIYKVSDMKNVEAFGKTKAENHKKCPEECKKECCKKGEGEKMVCDEDCKMKCCKEKKA